MQRSKETKRVKWLVEQLKKVLDIRNTEVDEAVDKLFRERNPHMRTAYLHTTLDSARYHSMQDWIEKKLSNEWTVYYLGNDIETYLFEHTACSGGAVTYTDEVKECSQCKTPVPGKLIMVVQMTLKRELLRV